MKINKINENQLELMVMNPRGDLLLRYKNEKLSSLSKRYTILSETQRELFKLRKLHPPTRI